VPLIPAGIRSFQWNPEESSGMKLGRMACYFFHSIILVEFGHSGIETRMFRGIRRNGMQQNGIWLFGNYIVWHSLFVCCTPVNKQTQRSSLSTTNHRFPPPPSLLPTTTNHARHRRQQCSSPPPPFVTAHKCQRPPMTAAPPRPAKKQRRPPTNDNQHPPHERQPGPMNGHRR